MAEVTSLVYIIRIWPEHREIEGAPLQWRGVIECLPGEERLYFVELEDMLTHLRSHFARASAGPARLEFHNPYE